MLPDFWKPLYPKGTPIIKAVMGGEELILIVAEGCPGCEVAKEALKGKAKIMDVTKDLEAAEIISRLKVYRVPLIVVKREDGGLCYYDGEGYRCVNPSSGEASGNSPDQAQLSQTSRQGEPQAGEPR